MNRNIRGFDDFDSAKKIPSSTPNTLFTFKEKHVFSTKNNPMCGVTTYQWFKILYKYGSYIEPKYIFRLLFISFLSIINSCLSAIEYVLYEKYISQVKLPDDPVFIIGHPRTGTTLIHNLLASDDENFYFCSTFCAGFPSSFLWFESIGKILFSGIIEKTRPMDSMPLHFDLPQVIDSINIRI